MTNGYKPAAEAADSIPITAEVGFSGLRRFGYQIDEEFEIDLKGIKGIRKYDEMRKNDPDVGALLTAIEMSLLSVDVHVEAGGDTDADEEAAAFVRECMDDMSHTWEDLMSEIMTMFPFGWAWFEKVYKQRNGEGGEAPSKFNDGRIGWRKIVLRGQESLKGWDFDDNGGILGMMQYALQPPYERYIPIWKSVLFRTKREKNNPEGYSILRNSYRPYFIKSNVEEIEVISAERDFTGIPVITLPSNASDADKTAAKDILRRLKTDEQSGIVAPRNGPEEHQWWKFELATSPGAPKVDTDKIISRNSTAIARSTLAQFLTIGQGRVGSYALVKDFRDLFHLALIGHLDNIIETMNRYMIEPLFKLNSFPGITAVPRLVHGRMGQRDVTKFATTLVQLAGLGMPVIESDWAFIRGELELPELPEDYWEQKAQEDAEKEAEEEARREAELERARLEGESVDQNQNNPNNLDNDKQQIEDTQQAAEEATSWLRWLWRK